MRTICDNDSPITIITFLVAHMCAIVIILSENASFADKCIVGFGYVTPTILVCNRIAVILHDMYYEV
jgi:hypothetical protein